MTRRGTRRDGVMATDLGAEIVVLNSTSRAMHTLNHEFGHTVDHLLPAHLGSKSRGWLKAAQADNPNLAFGIIAQETDQEPQTLDDFLSGITDNGCLIREAHYNTFAAIAVDVAGWANRVNN